MDRPDLANLALQPFPNALLNLPYCGQFVQQTAWFLQFNLDPLVVGVLALAGVWARMARGPFMGIRLSAILVAAILWVSPLCPASATVLSLRAVHHLGVMVILAPIMAAGWPRLHNAGAQPFWAGVWALGSAATFAIWFWPPAYSAAWNSDAVYWAMQLAMLGASVLFWRALFRLQDDGLALAIVPACALTSAAMGAVGAVLTFAPRVLLPEHQVTTMAMGIAPLHDQQLAGLIVWLFGMVPVAAFAMRAGWHSLVYPAKAKP